MRPMVRCGYQLWQVRVYKDPLVQHGYMPALPAIWPTTDCCTEVVLDSQAQVLPLGYIMVRRRQ